MKTHLFSKNQKEYLKDKNKIDKNQWGNAKIGVLRKVKALNEEYLCKAISLIKEEERKKILKNMLGCFTLDMIKETLIDINLEKDQIIKERNLGKSLVKKFQDLPIKTSLDCLRILRKSTKKDKEILNAIKKSPRIFLNGKIFYDLRDITERTRLNKNDKEKIFLELKKIPNLIKAKKFIQKVYLSQGLSKNKIKTILIDFFERGIILDKDSNRIIFLNKFYEKFKKKEYIEKNHVAYWGIEMFPFILNDKGRKYFGERMIKFNPLYKSKPTQIKKIEIFKKKYKGGGKYLLEPNYS